MVPPQRVKHGRQKDKWADGEKREIMTTGCQKMLKSLKVAITMKRVVKVHHQKTNVQRLFDRQYINNEWMWRQSDNKE